VILPVSSSVQGQAGDVTGTAKSVTAGTGSKTTSNKIAQSSGKATGTGQYQQGGPQDVPDEGDDEGGDGGQNDSYISANSGKKDNNGKDYGYADENEQDDTKEEDYKSLAGRTDEELTNGKDKDIDIDNVAHEHVHEVHGD